MKNFTKISRDSRKLYTVVKMHVINSLSVNKCMQRLDVYQIWLITYKYLTLTVSVNFDGFSLNLWSNHESVDLNSGSFGKRDDRLRSGFDGSDWMQINFCQLFPPSLNALDGNICLFFWSFLCKQRKKCSSQMKSSFAVHRFKAWTG